MPFEGDHFGAYSADEFDDFDEYNDDHNAGRQESAGDEEEHRQEDIEAQDDDEVDAANLEAESGWEPPPPANIPRAPAEPTTSPESSQDANTGGHGAPNRAAQSRAHEHLQTKTHSVRFPSDHAGAPIKHRRERSAYEQFQGRIDAVNANPYAPFASRIDWEVARWAKMRGPGSTAVSELLAIEELVTRLGLSYKNARELNNIVDQKLASGRPRFVRREIVVAGEVFEIFYRDVIQCIRALYGDPEFAGILVFTPERHYADAEHSVRVYFDVHTGKWWWETQKALEKRLPGATIVPIIISSDKTQLTTFGSKTAYPVYMTIGNLPKDVRRKPSRRGQILLAYLPSSNLKHIVNKAARRRTLANLFHACMGHVLAPLREAGVHGIDIVSGDGVTRRGHPIFAMYIGDYPEQLLVTCCKTGTCPKCDVSRDDVGSSTDTRRPLRDLKKVLKALDTFDDGATAFSRACREAGIKPVVNPFWQDLPYVDIFRSITPDILHQLYQGVIKHLLSWLKSAYGPEELDARCRRLPPNHQIRLFLRGVTTLQKVTGKEHGDISRFLLALVIGLPLPGGYSPVRLVRAVRAILDILYLSQYPAHTSDTLALLRDALQRFHANKSIFVDLGVRSHFKLPKLHSLDHYIESIKLFGTTDNYDTQYTERLHIDFAKDAYRATNHKDEFPQMTTWLERREKILRHDAYVKWRLKRLATVRSVPAPLDRQPQDKQLPAVAMQRRAGDKLVLSPGQPLCIGAQAQAAWTRIKIAKWPSVKALSFDDAAERYGAVYLRDALARFVVRHRDPTLTAAEVEQQSLNVSLHFRKIQAFNKLKFILDDAQDLGVMEDVRDAAHARPERQDKQGRTVPGRFDTVLVNNGTGGRSGVQGYEVAQLRLVFKLPNVANETLFPGVLAPGHLAYIERFTPMVGPDPVHGLYKVTRQRDGSGARLASVVEVRNIRRSCHLFPVTTGAVPRDWTSSTVLERCDSFWVNSFSDAHMYMSFF
ncbi:uncharacterized protein TRAVEDRAFT_170977 [Trametes versicolor FP-101664 SS1]|uniref:uncharacterized protein n=1 Tax=Trametes versicolor (strain FP-101664) TaxID=717944 RepID=UPI000462459D|nr:uncharacterized protein TRAVEDRAFT_170977 [Trametes versicolor FP-101664 SS1]EIW56974.1 hypothetical protein TRAVEDRAFT_170977 [Trametes versicolor FP-101664 SS1]